MTFQFLELYLLPSFANSFAYELISELTEISLAQQMLNYFTYKAVRTVMNQLYEMNPPQYRWLYEYVLSFVAL